MSAGGARVPAPLERLSAERRSVVLAGMEADERLDAAAFAAIFSSDGRFRMAGNPEVSGREAIATAVDGLFRHLAGLRHDYHRAWEDEDSLAYQATAHWTLRDGREVCAPYANVLVFDGDELAEYAVHIDTTELMQAIAQQR